ncbi:amino acid adenylation domain-containing protein [Streptomyces sp. NPDC001828]|uniref:amino acid adenylation domain-containing protein n=1 Tax=Streptomyces sp. NPDC001828 TaxID=3364615 RepID=UPI00367A962C
MAPPRPPAPERGGATTAPLSPAQERLWFIHQTAPASPVYNVPLLTRWHEPIDVRALTKALEALTATHEVLRTTYASHDGRPVQVVAPPGPVRIEVLQAGCAPDDSELARHARRPFALTDEPPLRATVWPGGAGHSGTLLLNIHHIAIDGWSLPALYDGLAHAYEQALAGASDPELPELPVQYADFAVWDAENSLDPALDAQLDARAALIARAAGEELVLAPAAARERVIEGDRRGEQHRFALDAQVEAAVAELARSLKVTPFVVLFAAFQAVVQRWSGREEFLLGTVAANRPHPSVARLVGFFVNTVPLLCAPDPEAGFDALCTASRAESFRVLTHQRLPFDRLAARLGPAGLADIGFVLQNAPAAGASGRWAPPELLPTGTAKQDLSLVLESEPGGGLQATVEYDTGRYTADTARHLAESYTALLIAAVGRPGTRLKDLPISPRPDAAPPHGVLVGAEPGPYPAHTASEALERVLAAADPGTVAVECAGARLTWGELNTWSAAVAARLRGAGTGPGSFVPVLAARGPALVAAWVGVLRAGAAFVPLATETPVARIAYILGQTEPDTVLVCPEGAALLTGIDTTAKPLALDELSAWPGEFDAAAWSAAVPGDPAAVIYTSGTTGRPKGVLVPQRGLLNTALWWGRDCGLGPADRLLLTAGTAFDPAAFNVVEALLAGAQLVIADDAERRDPQALLDLVRGPHGATVAGSITPSLLNAMLEADPEPHKGTTLRALYSGGEVLARRLAAQCANRWGTKVINVYGPTEGSCNSTYAHVDPADEQAPAIGVPLPGTRAYILGPHGEELPPGVPGELYVAGVGVAIGYLGRPDLTRAAFLPDPHATRFHEDPGARMYRTGDRVVLREDGRIGYLGRADDQVKILGNRIEPGEVTRLLEEDPAVAVAAVHATGTPPTLVAYVTLSETGGPVPLSQGELLRPLLRWLPAAALPTTVYVVDFLPRTINDKVDFAALSALRDRPLPLAEERPAELTAAQRQAAGLMADMLAPPSHGQEPGQRIDADALGPGTDFFTLGGHSLLAVRMLAEAERRWGMPVPLRGFLTEPTVAGLARCLEEARTEPASAPAPHVDPRAEHPASPVQQRMWAIDRIRTLRISYLAPSVVEIDGPVDRQALRTAFARTLERHPGLRSRFRLDAKARRVFYRTDGPAPEVVHADGTGWSAEEREERISEICWTPFDLARDAPARGAVIALGPERTLLVYGVHHIVSDGWSLDLVLSDVVAWYRALTGVAGRVSMDGTAPDDMAGPEGAAPAGLSLPGHPAAVRYGDAPDEAALEEQLAGLRGAPTDIALPHDRPRGKSQSVEADTRTQELDPAQAARLSELAAEQSCTSFMVAAVLLAVALARRGHQRDFLFTFPWAGRDGADRARTVGMFVNTLLVRADLRGEPSWREALTRVRASALAAYRHPDTPFDTLAAALHPDRGLSRPAVTPVYLNAVSGAARPPTLDARTRTRFVTPPRLKSKYELEFTVIAGPDRFALSFSYLTALFDADTVDGLLTDVAQAATDLISDLENSVLTTTVQTQPTEAVPSADLADRIAALWSEVLEAGDLAHDVNFFDAGGDSLLLIVLMERLSELTGRELDAADLFEHSTIEAQTDLLIGPDAQALTEGATAGTGTAAPGSEQLAPGVHARAGLRGRGRSGRSAIVSEEGSA